MTAFDKNCDAESPLAQSSTTASQRMFEQVVSLLSPNVVAFQADNKLWSKRETNGPGAESERFAASDAVRPVGKAITPEERSKIKTLVNELGSGSFAVRNVAEKKLSDKLDDDQLNLTVLSELKDALSSSENLEQKRRAGNLVSKCMSKMESPTMSEWLASFERTGPYQTYVPPPDVLTVDSTSKELEDRQAALGLLIGIMNDGEYQKAKSLSPEESHELLKRLRTHRDEAHMIDSIRASVEKLDFCSFDPSLTRDQLASTLSKLRALPNLKQISLPRGTTDDHLREIAGCRHLNSLRITADEITPDGLMHLKDLKALSHLSISKLFYSNEDFAVGLQHLNALPNLKSLSLYNCRLADSGLSDLKAPRLTELTMEKCRIENLGPALKDRMPGLKTLDLSDSALADETLKSLQGLKNLETLYLYKTNISDRGLAHLKDLEKLRHLNLDYTSNIDGTGLASLSNSDGYLPNLAKLSLVAMKLSDNRNLQNLKNLPNLKDLSLVYGHFTDQSLQYLPHFNQLERLNLALTMISGTGLAHLDLPQLRYLNLSNTPIKGDNLDCLNKLSKLEELHLSGADIKDAYMDKLGKVKGLKRLDLSSTALSDQGLSKLGGLTELQALNLSYMPHFSKLNSLPVLPKLESLRVNGNWPPSRKREDLDQDTQEDGLLAFKEPGKFTALRKININYNTFQKPLEQLEVLKQLPNLSDVTVSETVDRVILDKLSQLMPKVRFRHGMKDDIYTW